MANEFTTTTFSTGTEALPSVYFGTSTTTGFYQPATNQIGVAVSGAKLITFSPSTLRVDGNEYIVSEFATAIRLYSYYENAGHGQLFFYSARGTESSPAVLQSGDIIGAIYPRSWTTGTTFTTCGSARWLATELHSAVALGCKFQIYITPNTTASVTLGLEIGQDKSVTTYGDEIMVSTGNKYFGAAGVNGTWKQTRSTDDLIFARRESGSYATKLTIEDGTTGTLVLGNPVYNDANVSALILKTGGTLPGTVQRKDNTGGNTGIYALAFAVGEEGSGAIEIPHDYKEGTNLTFHVHWCGDTAPAGGTDNVKWALTYAVTRAEATIAPASTIYVETAFDTQYENKMSAFAAITGTTFLIGDQFNFTIKRVAASSDEYGGEALVETLGYHYQADTLGSRSISAK
jgi:hypothetical protein